MEELGVCAKAVGHEPWQVLHCLQQSKSQRSETMKWKEWGENHWVLITREGEVVDEIRRDGNQFFVLKSTNKKFVDINKAKKARMTGVEDGKRN
jgi:hypothetical protein